MYSNMKNAAILLAFAAASNAQTWSDCNPVEGDKCDPNPAVGTEESLDFQKLSKISDIEGVFTVDGGIKYDENWDQLSFDPETGMKMSINEEKHAPTLYSKNYIFFGHVEVELRAAPGAGIITSIVLQSDSLDEIDWEFVGNDQSHVQTNFFHKGIEDYGYGEEHEIATNPMENFHTYAIDWTPEAMVFSIDGQVVREAFPDTGVFPQTPCQLRIGTWVGGKGDEEKQAGTIEWAGGMAQWDKAPFDAYYRRIQIVDYAGGYEGAKQYEYSNTNGTWESIRVVGGKQVGFPDSDFPPVNNHEMAEESSTSASPSTSATVTPSLASSAASVVSSVLAEVSSAVSSAAEESSSAIESSSVYSESLTTTTTTTSASVSTVASSTPSPTSDGAEAEESGDAEAGASTLQKSGLALGVAALFACGLGSSNTAYGNTSTNAGPHDSNLLNKADPRVDSDRDHRANPTSGGLGSNTGAYGTTGSHNTHGTSGLGSSNTYGTSTNAGPHDSNLANKADPRVDSDRDHRANPTSGGLGSNTGAYGSSHTGTHTGATGLNNPGPAPNTAGPHSKDILNKVDPRVDSDRDGSKTVGQDQTYARSSNTTTAHRDPTDAAQVPPSVLAKHIGEPEVHHDDHSHDRARRNSATPHQEAHRGL